MTKISCFATFGVLACGLLVSGNVFGAPRPETSTYIDGNVSTLKPNTGGTLVFTDDKSMTFRTGLAEVAVPYSSISKAQLGATQEHSHDMPLPGPLKLLTRLHKTETQLLIVEFKNGLGESQTMTLSLAKPAASTVLSTIAVHTAKPADAKGAEQSTVASAKADPQSDSKDAWWGDSFWKTNRNQDTWGAAKPSN
jgi:hypothetical protein